MDNNEDDRTVKRMDVKECDKCEFKKKNLSDMIVTIASEIKNSQTEDDPLGKYHYEYLCLRCSLNKFEGQINASPLPW
jgi:hypothetical protein